MSQFEDTFFLSKPKVILTPEVPSNLTYSVILCGYSKCRRERWVTFTCIAEEESLGFSFSSHIIPLSFGKSIKKICIVGVELCFKRGGGAEIVQF